MQIIKLLNLLFIYLKYNTNFALSNSNLSCIIPYTREKCSGPIENRYICWIDIMSRERYWKCDNFDIEIRSNNLLILYPPFIDIFLNQSTIRNKLQFTFHFHRNQFVHDIDLRILNQIKFPINLTLNTFIRSHPTEILFRTYTWFKRKFYLASAFDNYSYSGFISKWEIIHKNKTIENNDIICFHFTTLGTNYIDDIYYNLTHICPLDQCSKNQNRICLGLTPCLNMGDNILLCQIDQLRSNDQFNSKIPFLYTDIIITTSNTQNQTLHTFSIHLLKSCIATRFIIIVIYGRLEIPLLNSTSFRCPYSLIIEVEFWHGHCSTFEILYTNNLKQMYERNLITLGNFYTGQVDKLNLTCVIYPSTTSITKQSHIFDLIIVYLLGIIICIMFIVGCYYRKH